MKLTSSVPQTCLGAVAMNYVYDLPDVLELYVNMLAEDAKIMREINIVFKVVKTYRKLETI